MERFPDLPFPAGHCPTVAIGGYLLGGGQGWNQGGWGIACSNVLAIDLVNAAGELITGDAQHNPDLFYGLHAEAGRASRE
jgi:FAD/FMN-containing dehydrogenase